jgi:DNA-binding protein H-NS
MLELKLNMDLTNYSTEELEQLLKILPEEIRRRESEDAEAALRKRKVFFGFQELAAKQGIDLGDL